MGVNVARGISFLHEEALPSGDVSRTRKIRLGLFNARLSGKSHKHNLGAQYKEGLKL